MTGRGTLPGRGGGSPIGTEPVARSCCSRGCGPCSTPRSTRCPRARCSSACWRASASSFGVSAAALTLDTGDRFGTPAGDPAWPAAARADRARRPGRPRPRRHRSSSRSTAAAPARTTSASSSSSSPPGSGAPSRGCATSARARRRGEPARGEPRGRPAVPDLDRADGRARAPGHRPARHRGEHRAHGRAVRRVLLQRARRPRRVVHALHDLRRAARGVRALPDAAQHRGLRPDVPGRGRRAQRRHHRGPALRPQRAAPRHAGRATCRCAPTSRCR